MDKEVNPLDELLSLFDERERIKYEVNLKIAVLLTPTVLMALYELFDVDSEAIEWVAVDLSGELLVITVNVSYKAHPNMSSFLKQMDKAANAAPTATMRSLRVGIPVIKAFDSVQSIKEYLQHVADKTIGPVEDEQSQHLKSNDQFDASELTKEQVEQLMLFQSIGSGEKQ